MMSDDLSLRHDILITYKANCDMQGMTLTLEFIVVCKTHLVRSFLTYLSVLTAAGYSSN